MGPSFLASHTLVSTDTMVQSSSGVVDDLIKPARTGFSAMTADRSAAVVAR